MFIFSRRLLSVGFILWALGTVALRFVGRVVPGPSQHSTVVLLYAASFVLMALLARVILRRIPQEQWLAGVALLILPTLVLDAFTSAFFPAVFPNLDPARAGVFGGWMLIFCAGAVAGALTGAWRRA